MLGAVIGDARPVELDGDRPRARVRRDAAFLRKKAEEPANRASSARPARRHRAALAAVTTSCATSPRARGRTAPKQLREDELVAGSSRSSTPRRSPPTGPGRPGRRAEPRRDGRGERADGQAAAQGNMQQMMARCRRCRRDMEVAQEELRQRARSRPPPGAAWSPWRERGPAGVKEIRIDPAAIDPEDAEILADMVLAAVNEAPARGPGAGRSRRWAAPPRGSTWAPSAASGLPGL